VQVDMRAGQLPPTEDNGVSYLKVPLKQLGPALGLRNVHD